MVSLREADNYWMGWFGIVIKSEPNRFYETLVVSIGRGSRNGIIRVNGDVILEALRHLHCFYRSYFVDGDGEGNFTRGVASIVGRFTWVYVIDVLRISALVLI